MRPIQVVLSLVFKSSPLCSILWTFLSTVWLYTPSFLSTLHVDRRFSVFTSYISVLVLQSLTCWSSLEEYPHCYCFSLQSKAGTIIRKLNLIWRFWHSQVWLNYRSRKNLRLYIVGSPLPSLQVCDKKSGKANPNGFQGSKWRDQTLFNLYHPRLINWLFH